MKYIVTFFDDVEQHMDEKVFDRVDDALRFHADEFINNLVPLHGPHPTIRESETIKPATNVDLSYLTSEETK